MAENFFDQFDEGEEQDAPESALVSDDDNFFDQFDAAEEDPRMVSLREHAEENIRRGTIATDEEGNPATVRSGSVNHPDLNEGRPTLIPFQWGGEILSQEEAEKRAIESGKKWPEFKNHEEATKASKALSGSLRVDSEEENYFDQFGFEGPAPEPGPADAPDIDDDDPAWSDYGRMVMSGAASVGSGVGWLMEKVSEDQPDADFVDKWVNDKFGRSGKAVKEQFNKAADDWVNERMEHIGVDSEGLTSRARAAMQAEMIGEQGTGTDKWNKVKLMTASSLAGTMAGMGMGSIFTKGLMVAGASAKVAGTVGFSTGEAAVAAPASGAATEEEVMQMTHEQLLESIEYQATLESLDLPEAEAQAKAKELVAKAAGGDAAAMTAVTTFILSAPFGNKLSQLTRGVSGKGRIGAAGSGAGTEATQEFFQSGSEKLSQNLAMIGIDPDRGLLDGVLEEAVGGAASGGLMGGAVGAGVGPQPADLDQDSALAEIERIQREAEDEKARLGGDVLDQAIAGALAAQDTGAQIQALMEEAAAQLSEEQLQAAEQADEEERAAAQEEAAATYEAQVVEAEKTKDVPSREESFETAEEAAETARAVTIQEAEAQREEQLGEQIEAIREPEPATLGDVAPALKSAKRKLKIAQEQKKRKVKVAPKPAPLQIEDQTPDVVVDKAGVAMSREQIDAERKRLQVDVAAGETPLKPSELTMERRMGSLRIAIETPVGNARTGLRPDGTRWSTTMRGVDYGFVRGTEGSDLDQVDVFVSTNKNAAFDNVFVIDQVNPNGEFDEHKAMLGFKNQAAAVRAYKQQYDKGWVVGPVTEMTAKEFETWVRKGDTKQAIDPALRDIPATEEDVAAIQERTVAKGRPKPKILYRLPEGLSVQTTEEATPAGGSEISLELVDEAGEVRGGITADVLPETQQVRIAISKVDEELQGKGIGLEMYNHLLQEAKSRGFELVSDTSVSAAAERVYAAMERRGATVIRNPAATRNDRGDLVSDDIRNPVFRVMPTDIRLRAEDLAGRVLDESEIDTMEAITETAQALMDAMPGLAGTIVQTPADLPDRYYEELKENDNLDARGFFDATTGDIYVIAANNLTVDEAIRTVLHEGVAHKGLRVVLADKLPGLLDDVWENGNQDAIGKIADRYGFDTTDNVERRKATEEYIAELAERSPNAPILRRIIDAVRAFLRTLGMLDSWTDSDIHALLRDVKREVKGRPLNQIDITTTAEVEETGEVVEISRQADVVLRQHEKRIGVVKTLQGCL